MANPDPPPGILHQRHGTPSIPKAPKIDVGASKSFEDRFTQRLDEMARNAAPPASPSQPGLVIDQLGRSTVDLLSTGTAPAGPARDPAIEEAKRLIAGSKFAEALKVLDGVLKKSPGHREASYLRGLCLFSLDKSEPALEALEGAAGGDPAHVSRVRLLRTQIREKLIPKVAVETALMAAVGSHALAIKRLDRLVALDPEGAFFHLIRAHSLMIIGQLTDAARALAGAEPYCQGVDREALDDLRVELNRRQVRERLKPARQFFRAWQYRKARASVDASRSEYGEQNLFKTFCNYLDALGGGLLLKGRAPADLAPKGNPKDVEELYFFLVEDELRAARPLIKKEDYTGAERVLTPAMTLAPRFPYLNFLMALAIHQAFGQSITAKKVPPLEQALARLQLAEAHAKVAQTDTEIENARPLLSAIQEGVRELGAVKAARDLIDPLVERFKKLMDSITSGKPTREKVFAFVDGMQKLRADAQRTAASATHDAARANVREIIAEIDKILDQIQGRR